MPRGRWESLLPAPPPGLLAETEDDERWMQVLDEPDPGLVESQWDDLLEEPPEALFDPLPQGVVEQPEQYSITPEEMIAGGAGVPKEFTTGNAELDSKLSAQVSSGEEQDFSEQDLRQLRALQSPMLTKLSPEEEDLFLKETRWNDDPRQFYDQRGLWKYARERGIPMVDESGHGLSMFKLPGHPTTMVEGYGRVQGKSYGEVAPSPPPIPREPRAFGGKSYLEGQPVSLEGIEKLVTAPSRVAKRVLSSEALQRGVLGLGERVGGAMEAGGTFLEKISGLAPIGAQIRAAGTGLKGVTETEPPVGRKEFFADLKEDPLGTLAEHGVENLPTLVAMMGSAAVTGSAMAPAFVIEAGAAWNEAREQGVADNEALLAAGITGTINMFLESVGAQAIVNNLGGKQAARGLASRILASTLAEGSTETMQEFVSVLTALSTYAGDKGLTTNDLNMLVSEENLKRYGASGVIGSVLGGGVTAAASPFAPSSETAKPEQTSAIEDVANYWRVSKTGQLTPPGTDVEPAPPPPATTPERIEPDRGEVISLQPIESGDAGVPEAADRAIADIDRFVSEAPKGQTDPYRRMAWVMNNRFDQLSPETQDFLTRFRWTATDPERGGPAGADGYFHGSQAMELDMVGALETAEKRISKEQPPKPPVEPAPAPVVEPPTEPVAGVEKVPAPVVPEEEIVPPAATEGVAKTSPPEEMRDAALRSSMTGIVGNQERWEGLSKSGATNEEIKKELSRSFGLGGGGSIGPAMGWWQEHKGGKNPLVTIRNPEGEVERFTTAKLIKEARRIWGIEESSPEAPQPPAIRPKKPPLFGGQGAKRIGTPSPGDVAAEADNYWRVIKRGHLAVIKGAYRIQQDLREAGIETTPSGDDLVIEADPEEVVSRLQAANFNAKLEVPEVGARLKPGKVGEGRLKALEAMEEVKRREAAEAPPDEKTGTFEAFNPEVGQSFRYREMPRGKLVGLKKGDQVNILSEDGETVEIATINSVPKTWKRTPGRMEFTVRTRSGVLRRGGPKSLQGFDFRVIEVETGQPSPILEELDAVEGLLEKEGTEPADRGPVTQMPGKRANKLYVMQGWNAAIAGWKINSDPYLESSTASDLWRKGFRDGSKPKKGGAPSGEAFAGTLAPPSVREGEKISPPGKGAFTLPELVEFAQALGNGKYPKVRKYLSAGRGLALGMFSSKTGEPGSGKITLRAEIAKDPDAAAHVLAHEIGHWIDFLPEGTLKRGNVLGRVAVLHRFTKGEYRSIKNNDLRKEMIELSHKWRPPSEAELEDKKFMKYRNSGKELYADALSALLNDPGMVEEEAPIFWDGFHEFLERKAEAGEAYLDIRERVQSGIAERLTNRGDRYLSAIQRGGTARAKQILSRAQEYTLTDLAQALVDGLIDENSALYKKLKQARKAGASMSPEDNPIYWVEELAYRSSMAAAYLDRFQELVLYPARAEGVTDVEFGAILSLRRAATEREALFNPLGEGGEFAAELMEDLEKRMGKQQAYAIEESSRAWWKIRQDGPIRLLKESKALPPSGYLVTLNDEGMVESSRPIDWSDGEWLDGDEVIDPEGLPENEKIRPTVTHKIETNANYARYYVTTYMEDKGADYISAAGAIYAQQGTLQEIGNPLVETALTDLSLIRMAHRTNTARSLVNFLDSNFPDDIRKAKRGKGGKFLETRERGWKTVFFLDGGKVQAYDMPVEMAEAVDRHLESGAGYVFWQKYINGPVRQLLVEKNPAWTIWNLARDAEAFAKNVVKGGPLKSAVMTFKYLAKASPEAAKAVFRGKFSEDVRAALDAGAMIRPGERLYRAGEAAETELEVVELMLDNTGLLSPAEAKGKGVLLRRAWRALSKPGEFTERVVKLAGWKYLQEQRPEVSVKERAAIVRSRVGTPNIMRRGTWFKVSNGINMFSNVAKEGWRAAWESLKEGPYNYIAKSIIYNVIGPRMWLLAAAYGLLGDDQEELVERIPSHDKRLYGIIPWGETADGKAVYTRIPYDHMGQAVAAITWDIAKGDLDPIDLLNFINENLPWSPASIHPALKIGWAAGEYFTAGVNPYDHFFGRPVIPNKVFESGKYSRESLGYFARWSWNQSGAGIIIRFNTESREGVQGELQKSLELPVVGPIIGRGVKVSDYGLTEKLRRETDELKSQGARLSLARERFILEALEAVEKVDARDIHEAMKELGIEYKSRADLKRRIKQLQLRRSQDPLDRALSFATSKKERELIEARRDKEPSTP